MVTSQPSLTNCPCTFFQARLVYIYVQLFQVTDLLFYKHYFLCASCLPYLGDYSTRVPPLPIPNREVKPRHADGTAYKWESRQSPFQLERASQVGIPTDALFLLLYIPILDILLFAFGVHLPNNNKPQRQEERKGLHGIFLPFYKLFRIQVQILKKDVLI